MILELFSRSGQSDPDQPGVNLLLRGLSGIAHKLVMFLIGKAERQASVAIFPLLNCRR